MYLDAPCVLSPTSDHLKHVHDGTCSALCKALQQL